MTKELWPKKFYPSSVFGFPLSRFFSPRDNLEMEMMGFDTEREGLTVSENDTNFFVEAQMPGLKPENIEVTLENGFLRIQGKREETKEDKEKKFHQKASYYFCYHIALPGEVEEKDVDAVYTDGVMKLTFQKAKQSRKKKIKVKTK